MNPVALHSVVFSAQTASGNRSAHLPFLSSRSIFLTAVKILPFARSTTPLDCGWYTEAKASLVRAGPGGGRAGRPPRAPKMLGPPLSIYLSIVLGD
jgi:hypothetical protein